MLVACLGWGSLVWDPRDLPLRGIWFEDGPLLPIEFARISNGRRVTLVLVEGVDPVRSLWALLDVEDLDEARKVLAKREGIKESRIDADIGFWSKDGEASRGPELPAIEQWAKQLGLDGVVWTALPPGFRESRGKVPEARALVEHLADLGGGAWQSAEEYIRRAPPQIDTAFRRVFESKFEPAEK